MTKTVLFRYNQYGDSMQKYNLVYEHDDEQFNIALPGKTGDGELELESCFIDVYTCKFKNEHECLSDLYRRGIISNTDGSLHIKRPKGRVDAIEIIFNDEKFVEVSYILAAQLKKKNTSTLPESRDLNICIGQFIDFFSENKKALEILNKTFCYKENNKKFVEHLTNYIKYSDRTITFLEPFEAERKNIGQINIYKRLKNYDLLREVKVWIQEYPRASRKQYFSKWQNPYEKFEMEQEEREEQNKRL